MKTERHPMIYDRIRKKHYVVAGKRWCNMTQRTMLCCFPVGENEYTFIHGAFDELNGKVYLAHRFYSQIDRTSTLSQSQRYVLDTHLLHGCIDEMCITPEISVHTKISKSNQQSIKLWQETTPKQQDAVNVGR